MSRKIVYDLETFCNFFSYTDVETETDTTHVFTISPWNNDLIPLLEYLRTPMTMIGFNNIGFDCVVLEYIFENAERLKRMDGEQAARRIYSFVQSFITSDEKPRPKAKNQIDLYLINHYNNKARSTSLKALQVSMGWHNVMDMPFAHDKEILEGEVSEVLEYNLNDVLSTRHFFFLNKEKMEFRETFSKLYKENFTNSPDVSIGESIFLRYIKQASGETRKSLKEKVIEVRRVDLSKCVLDYVKFQSPQFNRFLDKVKATVITEENKFRDSVIFNGFQFDFGLGGIHGCTAAGIYEDNEQYAIIDFDVKSYYPNLAIRNGFHPQHIDKDVFISTYEKIFDDRVEAQKQKDEIVSAGLKLALNGVFGKTGEATSPFYDRYYFYRITLNGQLLLAMLSETYMLYVPDLKILQVNTDGVTIRVNRDNISKVNKINQRFMALTGLVLEDAEYSKMVIRDVNNYMAVSKNGKVKKKGVFETEKEFHKDNSYLAVPKALERHFVDGISIKSAIFENTNIYDFFGRYKAYPGWKAQAHSMLNGQKVVQDFGKIIRFLPSKQGVTIYKSHKDGRLHNLIAGRYVKIFNRFENEAEWDNYQIDYDFFADECEKIIDVITPKQLTLF
jgi:hypothetical protein